MKTEQGRFRAARMTAMGMTILLAIAAGVAVGTPLIVRGQRFGRVVERFLPPIRGHIHIGGGRWTWPAVLAWVRGRPARFELEDIRMTDPEGIDVLSVMRLSGWVTIPHVASSGAIVERLSVEGAIWRFAEMKQGGVGFLAALEPRVTANRQTGKSGGRRDGLSIMNAQLDGVSVTFDLRDWGLELKDVHAAATLSISEAANGQPLAFELREANARGGGRLRILRGPDAFTLPFSHARLDSVATTPDSPDAIRLEASGITTNSSSLALSGTFTGVYGASRPRVEPGIDLHARFTDAADAIRAVAAGRGLTWPPALSGPGGQLSLGFVGPFAHLRVDAQISLVSPDGGRAGGDLHLDEGGLAVDLSFARFATTPLLPAPLVALAGGTLQGTARGRFDSRALSASVERMALTLTRSADGARPRVVRMLSGPPEVTHRGPKTDTPGSTVAISGAQVVAGTLHLPRLTANLWGGRLSASGRIKLTDPDPSGAIAGPKLDLIFRAENLPSRHLFGVNFVNGDISFRARVRGALHDLAVDVELPPNRFLRVVGEKIRLPDQIGLHLSDQHLLIPSVILRGPRKSELALSGRINLNGRLNLDIDVRDFPFDRLPGLAETKLPLAGRISGRLALSGQMGQPDLTGQVSFDSVTFQGRNLGGGRLAVSPGARGSIHVAGQVLEGIDAEGNLAPGPIGLMGDATLKLRRLRLDPFLAALPGGATAVGLITGTIVAHITPGQTPRADGHLTQLTLTVTPASNLDGANKIPRAIELHSEGDILLSAQAGAGPMRIGPARFAGDLGSFEIEAESHEQSLRGALRGRVHLDALAPLTAKWVDHLSGALDIQLRAARTTQSAPLQVHGEITIAAPLSGRARAVRFEAGIPSGHIRFLGDTVETTSLPVTFQSGALGAGTIRRASGSAHVTGRISNGSGRPVVHAAIDVDRAEVDVPRIGREPIAISAGRIQIDDRTVQLRALGIRLPDRVDLTVGAMPDPPGVVVFDSFDRSGIAQVDLPLRGDLRALETAGIRIDRASFRLRLRGQPRRSLLLAGDIDLGGAHVPSNIGTWGRKSAGSNRATGLPAELERMRLDLHVHAKSGAVEVDVRHVPDLHVGLDYHVNGTLMNPEASGGVRGAGAYSALMLWLGRLAR